MQILPLVIYAIISITVLLFVITITRLIFSIPVILRNQQSQTLLLAEIAKKHGVDLETIEDIVNERVGW